ncbi:MAG TPA: pilus assembly protein TadG-related protein, partial [Protaetiibacter sp.]|nr:pilus assembly protein TadG-related protein [Protaetiibacter sp.]
MLNPARALDRRSRLTAARDGGYVIALTAMLMLPLMAFTGLAVDLGAWYARAAQIQRTTDAASLAGVAFLPIDDGDAI